MGLPAYLVRWMAAFLIDRQQSVKIGDTVSSIGYPNGGVPQGTLSGPNNFLVQINDLQTPCPMFKYVDDSTVVDVCNNMRINATKTKEMVICFCRNDNHVASIPRIVIYIIIRHCPGVGAFPRPFCVPNSVALASLTLQVGD